jgi:hypothetical protein
MKNANDNQMELDFDPTQDKPEPRKEGLWPGVGGKPEDFNTSMSDLHPDVSLSH